MCQISRHSNLSTTHLCAREQGVIYPIMFVVYSVNGHLHRGHPTDPTLIDSILTIAAEAKHAEQAAHEHDLCNIDKQDIFVSM